ncbi:hypothetical protein ACU8KH_03742 [Lachancea thermotolerans]
MPEGLCSFTSLSIYRQWAYSLEGANVLQIRAFKALEKGSSLKRFCDYVVDCSVL